MRIGIADTMFSRVDMYKVVQKAIKDTLIPIKTERYTVPGVKDLPVASKILLEKYNCDIVLALGMPGDKDIDKICAHEASTGLIQTQILTNKHIIEVFVHLDEGKDDKELKKITENRTYDHTMNAIALLKGKTTLSNSAGKGVRQGNKSVGGI